ncbi:CoA transferase [Roseomonas eburnea]|uniref:CoA transferase n=1 Tax=Neoroseomonas eburnea TaxID=1346889 RepID=A0A9X9XGI9_9PROT|nr:CoA transferase [Neoroseomonas eburnea]
MSAPQRPLDGILVLDLGHIYQAPYCAFLMAMAGATVIKIEPPNGEPLRRRAAVAGGSVPQAMLNSNKQGLSIDLKNPKGREIFLRLVDRADVLIENFSPGAMDRLGLGHEALLKRNPRLIYAAGSGYGQTGPDRDRLAMDLTVQAAVGMMHTTGFPDGPPTKAGPTVCDFLGGTHLYGAVMTALFARERTGKGTFVEVAMQDAAYSTLASAIGMHFGGERGKAPPRTGNSHAGLAMAPYNVYRASDGWIAIIVVTEGHWDRLLRAMGQEALIGDERFRSNADRVKHMAEVDGLVTAWTSRHTRAELEELTRQHGVPAAPVRTLEEVLEDPGMHERGMLRWVDHPEVGRVVLPSTPLRLEGAPPPDFAPSPFLNQHEAEVLGGMLGIEEAEREALRAAGALGPRFSGL